LDAGLAWLPIGRDKRKLKMKQKTSAFDCALPYKQHIEGEKQNFITR